MARGPEPGSDSAHKRQARPKQPLPGLGAGRPKRPADLKGEARAEWNRLVPELEAAGLLCKVDRAALVELCRSWADLVDARQILAAEGTVVETPIQSARGEVIGDRVSRHPAVMVLNDAFKRWSTLAKEYGLTAAGRLRMKLGGGDAGEGEDELLRILRGDDADADAA